MIVFAIRIRIGTIIRLSYRKVNKYMIKRPKALHLGLCFGGLNLIQTGTFAIGLIYIIKQTRLLYLVRVLT